FIQERQAQQEAAKKEADKPIKLTRSFAKAWSFLQTMTTETRQTTKVLNNEVVQSQGQTFYFSWTPEKLAGDNWIVRQRIERIQLTIDVGGSRLSYDSNAPGAANPLSNFKELVGAEFMLTIDKN